MIVFLALPTSGQMASTSFNPCAFAQSRKKEVRKGREHISATFQAALAAYSISSTSHYPSIYQLFLSFNLQIEDLIYSFIFFLFFFIFCLNAKQCEVKINKRSFYFFNFCLKKIHLKIVWKKKKEKREEMLEYYAPWWTPIMPLRCWSSDPSYVFFYLLHLSL